MSITTSRAVQEDIHNINMTFVVQKVEVFKHDISHAELDDIVQHIKSGRGLILDADA